MPYDEKGRQTMTLGEKILKYRKKAGISQEELADMLNVTRQSISLWETDQTVPSLDNLITLSKIFDVSMDELCGREKQRESNTTEETPVAMPTEADGCIARSETAENNKLLNNFFWLKKGAAIISCAVAAICALLLIVPIVAAPYTDTALVCIPIVISLPFISAVICLLVPARKKFFTKAAKLRPNCVYKYAFYAHRFEAVMTSDVTTYSYSLNYEQIKKIRQNDDYIFVYYNRAVLPIEKESLGENLNVVLKLFRALNYCANPASAKMPPKRRRAVKTALYIMFALSILSLYLAILMLYIDVQYDHLHQYLPTYVEHLWVLYAFIPIPLASLIFGIVCVAKKIAGKRNVIAGVVMCAVLLSGGSFTALKNKYIAHDHNFAAYIVEEISPITLPKSGRISYSSLGNRQNGKTWDAMIQAPSKQEALDCFNNSDIEFVYHLKELNLPSNFLEPYYKTLVKNFTNFCLYNCHTQEANTIMEGIFVYIFVAYDARYETFYVLYRTYNPYL